MNRDYNTGIQNNVVFFTGIEVENTPAFGKKTLFVVGIRPISVIIDLYNNYKCDHIYLGANQSFDRTLIHEWDNMITHLLSINILVTLDLDIKDLDLIKDKSYLSNELFILQISVKLPNIHKFNKNTTIKIDDIDFKATNLGVWCHKLNDLTNNSSFTSWDMYTKDEPLNE